MQHIYEYSIYMGLHEKLRPSNAYLPGRLDIVLTLFRQFPLEIFLNIGKHCIC
jgi:hypothetical protein